MIRPETHPTEGTTAAIRSTIRFDEDYPPRRSPSQPRGWETRAILEEAGFVMEEIERLIADGAALVASSKDAKGSSAH